MTRPCLDCGEPTSSSRCDPCSIERARRYNRRRGSATARGYGYDWQRLSAKARRLQPYCIDCGSTEDLTADHVVPKGLGGPSTMSNVVVRCRSCNARKGARMPTTEQLDLFAPGLPPRAARQSGPSSQARSQLLIVVHKATK